jgi:signal transduction histidine kinase
LCRSSTDAVEVWRVGPTGARQPLLASAAEIHDGSGRLVEVVHSLRDITRLKEADEAKTTFLATTSHELKTPLTVINGYADLLIRDDSNEELRRQGLAAIATRGKELASIVERLLMSSQIESGRMSINLHAADVVSLVRERVETFAIVSGHEVILRADDRTPAAAVDVVAFATIVDHLLDNAAKYSDEDSRITVTVNPADSAWVDVAVSDEGAGMTPDQRQQCFDKFWQADGSDSRSRGGTGLGLFIVKSLAEGMGGAVTAASTLGEGTTFTVSLPAAGENVVPVPRVTVEAEPSMIREFMRQIGVPGGGAA